MNSITPTQNAKAQKLVEQAMQVGTVLMNSRSTEQACTALASLPPECLKAYCIIKGLIDYEADSGTPDPNPNTNANSNAQDMAKSNAAMNLDIAPTPVTRGVAALIGLVIGRHTIEKSVRRPSFDSEVKQLDPQRLILLLHEVAVSNGAVTYLDPATGYTVFTSFSLVTRDSGCCGVKYKEDGTYVRTHKCRHCPYDMDGKLSRKDMKELKARGPMIAAYRDAMESEMQQLASKIVSVASSSGHKITEAVEGASADCGTCRGSGVTPCPKCMGLGFLITPDIRKCHICNGQKQTPCLSCTGWQIPVSKAFGE